MASTILNRIERCGFFMSSNDLCEFNQLAQKRPKAAGCSRRRTRLCVIYYITAAQPWQALDFAVRDPSRPHPCKVPLITETKTELKILTTA